MTNKSFSRICERLEKNSMNREQKEARKKQQEKAKQKHAAHTRRTEIFASVAERNAACSSLKLASEAFNASTIIARDQ